MTTTEIERVAAEVVHVQAPSMGRESIDLIKRTIAPKSTDDELALFVKVCERTGLDPFARQIFAVSRWDAREQREVMSIQTSIDGFRLIAQRSGDYAGQTPPEWCGEDGVWRDVWLRQEPPQAARIGVLRRSFSAPLYAIAHWGEYKQTNKSGQLSPMWARMPSLMLSKCAESLALRKAFPAELSGLYTTEEMAQAERVDQVAIQSPPMSVLSDEAKAECMAIFKRWEALPMDMRDIVVRTVIENGGSSLKAWIALNPDEASEVIAGYESEAVETGVPADDEVVPADSDAQYDDGDTLGFHTDRLIK